LRHDSCKLYGQLFGEWEPVVGDPLARLIAVKQPLSLRFALEIVTPEKAVSIGQPDHFCILELAKPFFSQGRLPFRDHIAELYTYSVALVFQEIKLKYFGILLKSFKLRIKY